MSNNNNEMNAFIFVLAMAGAVALAFAALVAAFVVMAAIALTILALCAWNKEIFVFGEFITPREAREFIGRGLIGAVATPIFFAILLGILDHPVHPDTWYYFIFGGYCAFSAGIEMLKAHNQDDLDERADKLPTAELQPPAQTQAPTPKPVSRLDPSQFLSAPIVQPRPKKYSPAELLARSGKATNFRYASWNDEEIKP